MKWIKLFEGYLDQPEYEEIDLNILISISTGTQVTISPTIINQIKEKIPNNVKFKLINITPTTRPLKALQLTSDKFPVDGWKVTIYELEDEWFVVCDHNPLFSRLIQKSFKCDGTPGLLKCLKDLSIIS